MADYLKMVQENGFNIKNVPADKRTEEICIAAVTDKPMAIRHIIKPSEAVCKIALLKDSDVLDFIDGELIKAYGLKDYIAITLPPLKQTEDDAVNIEFLNNSGSLKDIKNPSYKVCKFAVKNSGEALKFVPEKLKTIKLCEFAVNQNGWALRYVPEELKTKRMCKIAIKKHRDAIVFVPKNINISS